MTYILIVIAIAASHPVVIQQEFNSVKECENARLTIVSTSKQTENFTVRMHGCFAKG